MIVLTGCYPDSMWDPVRHQLSEIGEGTASGETHRHSARCSLLPDRARDDTEKPRACYGGGVEEGGGRGEGRRS